MSKRTKIIIGLVILVFLIGIGIFNYLYSTGRIKLKAASTVQDSSLVINYPDKVPYNTDGGRFVKMTVSDKTAGRGTSSDNKLQVQAGDTLEYSVVFRANKGGYLNLNVYDAVNDSANTNFAETMDVIKDSGSISPPGPGTEGAIVHTSCLSMSCYHNGQDTNAVCWVPTGNDPRSITSGSEYTILFRAKVKSNVNVGTVVKNGWAACWRYNAQESFKNIYSGDGNYSHLETKVIASATPQPTPSPKPSNTIASTNQVLLNFDSTALANYAKSINFPAYGDINKMWVKDISGGRGTSGNTLLVYPGDKIQIGVQVVDFIKDGADGHTPNGLSGAGVYNAPEDPGNTNFAKYTNWRNATMSCASGCTNGGDTCGWTDNVPYSNFSNPNVYGYGAYMWSIPKDHLLRPDWCPKDVTFTVTVKSDAPDNATFKTGWAFGWCTTYLGQNNGQLYSYQWSGDGFYPFIGMKVVSNPTPIPVPTPASIVGEKTVDKKEAGPGDVVTYTLTNKNEGETDAPNFVLKDNVSDVLKYAKIESIADGGQQVGDEIQYTKTIAAGATVTTHFSVKVNPVDQWPQKENAVMLDSYQPSTGSPITNTTVDLVYKDVAAFSKFAFNETQNKDATAQNANPGDVIRYTLTTENKGGLTDPAYSLQEDVTNILRYADIVDAGGGKLNNNTLTWTISVSGNSQTATTFKVKIKSADQWPKLGDLTISNTYGPSTVNVKLEPQSVLGAVVAPVSGVLTASGTMILIVILVALIIVLIYLVVRVILTRRKT